MASVTSRSLGLLILAGLALPLAGCGGFSRALGLEKSQPDEFAIVTKAPLIIPPDYSLRPPASGTRGPIASDSEVIAARALIGDRNAVTPGMSAGERILVTSAGAQNADPMIREVIDQEYASLLRKGDGFTNQLIFWQDPAAAAAKGVNASSEAERIEAEAATGRPTDQKKPTITEKKPGIFDGLF